MGSTTKGHNVDWNALIEDLEARGEIADLEGMLADWGWYGDSEDEN